MDVSPEMAAARARLREKFGEKASQLGGKGTARRKAKKVHKTAVSDDKKLQQTLKRHGASYIPGIEDVQIVKDDGTVLTFTNPKVQAAPQSNTYVVTGTPQEGTVASLSDFAKLVGGDPTGARAESIRRAFAEAAANGTLEKLLGDGTLAEAAKAAAAAAASAGEKDKAGGAGGKGGAAAADDDDDDDADVPDLIDNFEDVSKQ